MTEGDARSLGERTSTFGPWARYGFTPDLMTRTFMPTPDGACRYTARVDGALAGGFIARPAWLVGPYLQMLAVLPAYQGTGLGGLMLDWFETRARASAQRNAWLCVSAFNPGARKFYAAHGWREAADLPGLIDDGVGEVLMRKVLE